MKIWYMRDNHTFLTLSNNVDEALAQVQEEFEGGYTSGMVCTRDSSLPPIHTDYRDLKGSLRKIREWYKKLSDTCVGANI
jgi:hypothetical protein